MKQRIIPSVIYFILVVFFIIIDIKGIDRNDGTQDVEKVFGEGKQETSSISVPEATMLETEVNPINEAKLVEMVLAEAMPAIEKQTKEDRSVDKKTDSEMHEAEVKGISTVDYEYNNAPVAIPVLTPEEAEGVNQDAIHQSKDKELMKQINRSNYKKQWRQDYNSHFIVHFFIFAICMTIVSILTCLILKRKRVQKMDLLKASVSTVCSSLLLLFLYSIFPYFYNFWSLMNVCLVGIVAYILFRCFEKIWVFNKRDIILIPAVLGCAWLLLINTNPRTRDIPNSIVLETEAKDLMYNGVVCNNNLAKTKKDFLANYKYITFDEGWKQTGSYKAAIKGKEKKKGRLTLHIPTELIETYDLCIDLTANDEKNTPRARGRVVFNDSDEIQWETNKETYLIPLNTPFLYAASPNCPVIFFAFCFAGAFVFILSVTRLIENILMIYFQGNQYAYNLLFLLVCAICFAVCFKEILFIDNGKDIDAYGAQVFPSKFSSWKPAVIFFWWKIAIFLSPLESWNASFALCTLFSFYIGLYLVGSSLIKKGCKLCPYLLVFSCFNIIRSKLYPSLFIDLIVASQCLLAFGLCTFASSKKNLNKFFLFIILAYLTFIISLVRGESLSCAVPILIVFFSLTIFQAMRGWKRIILSGLLGSITAIMLFCSYKFILSPYVIHETPFNNNFSIIDNYFREVMGICYFSKDWDDLPEWYTQEAEAALDKTKFIERPHYYRVEYLPKVTKEEILVFWAHMVKKHPWTYLKVKWVGNQVLWRLRTPFAIPYDVRLDNDSTKTGLSLHNFFKEGLSTCGIVIPSWLPQVSLLFLFVFTSLLLLKFDDSLLWIIWGIGTSGFLHNFAFFLISGAPNYRYIYWADICGCMSFFLSCLVIGKYFEYLRRKYKQTPHEENNNETLCPNTLFQ